MRDGPAAAGLRVLLLARYGVTGASSRVRHHAFQRPLAARGVNLDTHHVVDDDSLAQFYRGQSRNWGRIVRAYMNRMRMTPDWTVESEADAVARLDIGIMPLGQASFFRHKSCWKVYQYMAAGRPVVANRIGFSEVLIEDGVTGFPAGDPGMFERRLRQLVADQTLRIRMGRAAQAAIAARYDIERGADGVAALFREVVAAKRARAEPQAWRQVLAG